jgi:hypothetical protein
MLDHARLTVIRLARRIVRPDADMVFPAATLAEPAGVGGNAAREGNGVLSKGIDVPGTAQQLLPGHLQQRAGEGPARHAMVTGNRRGCVLPDHRPPGEERQPELCNAPGRSMAASQGNRGDLAG